MMILDVLTIHGALRKEAVAKHLVRWGRKAAQSRPVQVAKKVGKWGAAAAAPVAISMAGRSLGNIRSSSAPGSWGHPGYYGYGNYPETGYGYPGYAGSYDYNQPSYDPQWYLKDNDTDFFYSRAFNRPMY